MAQPEIGTYILGCRYIPNSNATAGLEHSLVIKGLFGRLASLLTPPSQQQALQTSPRKWLSPPLGINYIHLRIRKVWDAQSGECLYTLQHAHIVRAVAFPPQSQPQILATGGAEKKFRIFDLSRTSRNSSSSSSPTSPISFNGASNGDGVSHNTPVPSYEIGPGVHGGTIKSVVWGSMNVLVTACEDKKIRWWDIRARAPVAEYEVPGMIGSCELNQLLPSAGGPGSVLSVAAGKSVLFFDGLEPARLLKSVKTPYETASVALSPDGTSFVTGGSADTWVRVYDYNSENELGKHLHFSLCRLCEGLTDFLRYLQRPPRTDLVGQLRTGRQTLRYWE